MMRIRKVLCPVDFFPASEAALSYAVLMARKHNARVHILHVVPPVTSVLSFAEDTGQLVKSTHEESERRLATMAKITKASGISVSTEVRFGEIDAEILHAVNENKANLVVAGTHGRHGFDHWLIGSVCERLLRRAHVPLLTIARAKKATRPPNIKQVWVGVDFSAGTEETASWAFSMAQTHQASVTLVHVTDFITGDVPGDYKQSLLDGIRLKLEKLIPPRSKDVTVRVEFGIPFRSILRLTQRDSNALIVVGSHGSNLLHRALLGSTAERIIRGSSIPVLTVPTLTTGTV